jgi:hypothetical protein
VAEPELGEPGASPVGVPIGLAGVPVPEAGTGPPVGKVVVALAAPVGAPAAPAVVTGAAATGPAVGVTGSVTAVAAGGSTVGSDCVWVRPCRWVAVTGCGTTVLPGSDLALAAAGVLLGGTVTSARLTAWAALVLVLVVSLRLRGTSRAGFTELATTTLAGGAAVTAGLTAGLTAATAATAAG